LAITLRIGAVIVPCSSSLSMRATSASGSAASATKAASAGLGVPVALGRNGCGPHHFAFHGWSALWSRSLTWFARFRNSADV
jgi:hypothetical protein